MVILVAFIAWPKLILYRASGEKIIQGPGDILKLLQAENIVREGTIRARNPITHGQYCFVVSLADHDTLITLAVALIPAVIAWLKGRRGRRVELQKGDMKVSAPDEKTLEAALKSLKRYEKFSITVHRAPSTKKRSK